MIFAKIKQSPALQAYCDKRMLLIFGNGIASGFPWVLIGSAMTLWLKDAGLTRTAIGLFGSIFVVYAINFIWAPLVDGVKLPVLKRLGQRRSWIVLMQLLLFCLVLLIALTDPGKNLLWTSLLALAIAIISATQDVAIDAYRIEIISEAEKNKLPATSAMATAGWWTGYSLPGAMALFLAAYWSWSVVYFYLALCVLFFIAFSLFLLPEPARRQKQQKRLKPMAAKTGRAQAVFLHWCYDIVVKPFKDFFLRFGWFALTFFLFILLFKVGEAFLGRMSLVFYKEIGFTLAEIATYSKLIGWGGTVIFSLLASIINIHYGLIKGLIIGGIAMASTNLIFAYMAWVGPDTTVFFWAVILDNFTAAFATVSFVAFISHLTNRVYTATQYALMASIGNFGRTFLSSGSGWLVDYLDGNWVLFFVITAVMVVPSLLLLLLSLKRFKALFL